MKGFDDLQGIENFWILGSVAQNASSPRFDICHILLRHYSDATLICCHL